RMAVAGDEAVERIEHGQSVGAVGLDLLVLFIPVPWAVDVIGPAQGGELAVQGVAEGAGFVAGDDLPALGELLFYPLHQGGGCETLRGLGMAAVVLAGGDVPGQMHV